MMHHGRSLSGRERNCVFLNSGGGTFATVSALSGFDMPDDARGLALMDWDFDGKVDFWMSARTAPRIRFMHNQLQQTGDWLGLRLRGTGKSNRDAIGARVKVTLANGRLILRSVRAGEGFASQSSKWIHMGLDKNAEVKSIVIHWPSGNRETIAPPEKNGYYTLTESTGKLTRIAPPVRKLASRKPRPLASEPAGSTVRAPLYLPVPLPAIRYSTPTEKSVVNGKLPRPLLINLWSQSCPVCRDEIEEFTRNKEQLQGKVDVLALCIDPVGSDHQQALAYAEKIQFPWRVGFPSRSTIELLASVFNHSFPLKQNLPAPASLLVSPEGNIVALYTRATSTAELLTDIGKLTANGLSDEERDKAVIGVDGMWLKHPTDLNLLYLPQIMMRSGRIDDAASYVRKAHGQLSKHREYAKLLIWIAEQNMQRGNKKEAIVFYNNALNAGKDKPFVLNNIAWLLSTHADDDVRNGKLAVQLAHRACKITDFKDPSYIDTLAAAYAEIGDFANATGAAKHALTIARKQENTAVVESLEKALEHYRQRKAMRQ